MENIMNHDFRKWTQFTVSFFSFIPNIQIVFTCNILCIFNHCSIHMPDIYS